MERVRPLLRIGLVGLPLLAAGCAGDQPSASPADDSCILLCALARNLAGAPPSASTPPPAMASRTHADASRVDAKPLSKRGAAPATPRLDFRHRVRPRAQHPTDHPPAQTSVVPQTPPASAPAPVAVAPPSPAPPPVDAVAPPVSAPSNFSQIIPGATSIMPPGWQER